MVKASLVEKALSPTRELHDRTGVTVMFGVSYCKKEAAAFNTAHYPRRNLDRRPRIETQ